MASSADSQEHHTITRARSDLACAIQHNLVSLSNDLIATQLISDENGAQLSNPSREEYDRATRLVELVTNKVKQDPQNYSRR